MNSLVRPADMVDMAVVALLIYALLVWFKKTRTAFVVQGLLVLMGVYVMARVMEMYLTTSIFQGFFAVILVALVVIFQEELRTVFERIAVLSLPGTADLRPLARQTGMLTRTIHDMAADRVGALIVLRGRDPLDRHVEGGWELNGLLSEPLIKSLFDYHSMGHDGAVIIEGERLTRFGCHLPLSKDFSKTDKLGTRHSAALGIVELTDALVVVVSEERGSVSVAREGSIETLLNPDDLGERISRFVEDTQPQPHRDALQVFLQRNVREKVIATVSAVILWFFIVFGAKEWRQAYELPAVPRNLAAGMRVVRIQPERVRVVFAGKLRDFYWVDRRGLAARVDLTLAKPGANLVRFAAEDVVRPAHLSVEEIDPLRVAVDVAEKEARP
ncbi:MAG TPA: hypothetical protein DD417_14975 [Elusimicrobia bacterium]|nr:hypothetical protein [Elusimicrobiota bacterium]